MEMRISVEIDFLKGRSRYLTDVTEVANAAMLVYEDKRGVRYGFPVNNIKEVRVFQYVSGAKV